ncbi:hypothetical protein [Paenibacillus macerans]
MEAYTSFKKYFGQYPRAMELLVHVQDMKLEDEMLAFYPKNWFVDGQ